MLPCWDLLLPAERSLPAEVDSVAIAVVRALVLLKLTNLLFQIEVLMRADVSALFALATRSRNLLLRRATSADRELLAAMGSREVRWATVYLVLDVPGVAWATWYLVVYGLPSIVRIAELSLGAISTDGLPSLAGVGGALALALCFGPLGWTLWGVARNADESAG